MKQLAFKTWGGRRKGSGRTKTGNVRHVKREDVDFRKPLHITKRLKRGLRGLCTKGVLRDLQRAMRMSNKNGAHVVEFSLQTNHVHLIVEAKDNRALAKGMNALWAVFGKAIRARLPGRGAVFSGRYYMKVIRSARYMRNALEYVLLNDSKHSGQGPDYSEFNSAMYFAHFGKLLNRNWRAPLKWASADPRPDFLEAPRSWLCREGWRRACAVN